MDPVAIVTQFLALVGELIPNITSSATIAKVIAILEQVIPLAIQVGEDLVAPIKDLIAALKTSGAVTTDQLDQLDALEAKLDADFDAAAAAAQAADAAKPAS
jgi:hypothetical protein